MDKKAIRTILTTLALGLFCVNSWSNNTGFSADFFKTDVLRQFRNFLVHNNHESPSKTSNTYIFEYYPGEEWAPPPCTTTWVKESGTASLMDETQKCNLDAVMANFNANNQDGIKVYSIYIHPPAFTMKTDIPTKYTSSGEVLRYLKDKSPGIEADQYEGFISTLIDQISAEINSSVYGNSTEKILVLSSLFRFKQNNRDSYRVLQKVKVEGAVVNGHLGGINTAVNANTGGIVGDEMAGANFLILATQAIMDYFSDPDLIAGSNASVGSLMQIIKNQTAKDFLLAWYDDYSNDAVKKYVFAIAQYIDRLDPVFPYDTTSQNHQFNFGWAESSIVDYYNTISQYSKWRDFVAGRIDLAHQEFVTNNNGNYYRYIGVWYENAQDIDYENLTWERRAKLLELNQHGWDSQNWLDWNISGGAVDLYITKKILAPAITQHSTSELTSLIALLSSKPRIPTWFFEMADVFSESQQSEQGLMDVLSALVLKATGFDANPVVDVANDFNNRVFPWKPVPWYSQSIIKYTQNIDTVGLVDRVMLQQSILEDCTYNCSSYYGGCPPQCTYQTESFDLGPFDLVAVTLANKMNFLLGCGEEGGNCQNETLILPAIAFAWMIEKKSDDDLYNGIMTTIDVVSMFFGAGELMLAIKAGNRAKMFLAGWSVMSDMANIWLSNYPQLQNDLVAKYGAVGNDYYNYINIINTINGVANGFSSFLDVDQAAEAVATYKYLESTEFNFNALNNTQKAELKKRMADVEAQLKNSNKESKILALLATYFAKATPAQIAAKYSLPMGSNLAVSLSDIPGSARLLDDNLASKINGLGMTETPEFLEDLVKTSDDFPTVNNIKSEDLIRGLVPQLNDELVDAWSYLRSGPGSQIKRDKEILVAAARFLTDNPNMTPAYQNKIRDVIDAMSGAGAGCKTCRSSNPEPFMKPLHEIIDQLSGATFEFLGPPTLPGFYSTTSQQTFIGEMTQGLRKARGGVWVLDAIMSHRNTYFGDEVINGFEVALGNNRVDITTIRNGTTTVYYEFKNWGQNSLGSSYVDQFARTLREVDNLDEMRDLFNPNRWTPTIEQIRQVLSNNANSLTTATFNVSDLNILVNNYYTALPNPPANIPVVNNVQDFIRIFTEDEELFSTIIPVYNRTVN